MQFELKKWNYLTLKVAAVQSFETSVTISQYFLFFSNNVLRTSTLPVFMSHKFSGKDILLTAGLPNHVSCTYRGKRQTQLKFT
jgi:hypothetical protein